MRKFIGIFLGIFVTLLILGVTIVAFADAEAGDMFSWQDECGYICYQWADGSGDCYPCLTEVCYVETPETNSTPNPVSTPTPRSNPDPTPESTPRPEPTEKPKCNRGLGNGSEGCDPGNSGGKPGSAGEGNE